MLSPRIVLLSVSVAFLAGLLLRFPDYLTAAATAVLAGFAGVQIWVERSKRQSEERSANARLSANAFETRKALADWILTSQETGWIAPVQVAQGAIKHAADVRDRLEQGLIDASAASPPVAARMRAAYAQYQRAVAQFESYLGDYHRMVRADVGAVARGEVTPNVEPLSAGRESFRACCFELDRVVEPALLAEAKRLGAWREV